MLDDKGRRIVLILGLCLFSVSTLLLVVLANIGFIFVLRFFQGIGLSAYSTALGTILSDVVPASRLSEGVGYFGISATIAIIFMLFLTLAFAYSLPVVLLAAVFYGVGYGTVQPIMNTIVIKLSPPERRGAANATYYATMDIGIGIGSLVWGMVSQKVGFTVVFLSCAFCIILAVLAYYLILHKLIKKMDDKIERYKQAVV